MELPAHVGRLAGELAELPGVVAVVLGGSRATATHRPDSDWDLGVYYRGSIDDAAVRSLGYEGYVSEAGEWGLLMNGGAWLTVGGTPVDVLYRDLDAVEEWVADAERGDFEVLVQNGYVVGAPTYVAAGELATCRALSGAVPRPAGYPDALASSASRRWTGRAGVSLMFARAHASADDAVCCAGMLADAVLCVGHARLAERREWVVNEKRLVQRAGLAEVQPLMSALGGDLVGSVDAVAAVLGVEPLVPR